MKPIQRLQELERLDLANKAFSAFPSSETKENLLSSMIMIRMKTMTLLTSDIEMESINHTIYLI